MKSRKPVRIIAAVAIATAALVVVNAAYSVVRDYDSTVVDHEIMARDLAAVVADQAARSVNDTSLALKQIEAMARSGGGLAVFRGEKEWEALRRIAQRVPGGIGVVVADRDGAVVASSVARSPLPTRHSEHDDMAALANGDVLQVGAAVRSKLDDDEVVYTINRRISDSQGAWIGVASAGVTTRHLTEFYDLFGFSKDPGIVVFRDNGDIVARRPDIRDFIGKNIGNRHLFRVLLKQSPQGVFRARSPMDGIDRINAYRRVGNTGLVVLVGLPWEAVTAEWRVRTWSTVVVAVLSILAIGAAALWGNASLARAIEAERRLAGERTARERMRTFLDMAAHEFKTPLAVIDSSAQMLEAGREDRAGIGRRLALIRGSVRRVVDLIDTCLTGARVDDDYPVRVLPFDPARLIEDSVTRQQAHGAVVAFDGSALPPECVADPDLLGIALDALIDNARRYGAAGAAIDVTARREGRSLVVCVSDRGPGIADEEVARVFEKYYRGTRTRGVPGTGIGLSLVRTVAQLHGGEVGYRPRDGGGATFTLVIPLNASAG